MTNRHTLIDVHELHAHLDDAGLRVVDCRFDLTQPDKAYELYRADHIPGAVYAHLDRDLAGPVTATTGRHPLPEPAVFAATLGHWGISPTTRVVVYDEGPGAIAARLWWMLRWVGHRQVRLLDGGLEAWRRAGLELTSEMPVVQPSGYVARPDDSMIITTGEVEQALVSHNRSSNSILLVDARTRARFAGEVEPIDPVAGHIPGARNFPFSANLGPDGIWRPAGELRQAWQDTLTESVRRPSGRDPARPPPSLPWAAMCGSGVTACHLAVSAELAGMPAPRLYVGSWSEWIRDSRRPVATGPA